MSVPHYFNYQSFVVNFKVGEPKLKSFLFSFKIVLAILGSLYILRTLASAYQFSKKKKKKKRERDSWNFERDYIKTIDFFGEIVIFDYIKSFNL